MTLLTGDCIERMAALPAESVDAVVTDPPYGLEFMGKEWDRLWSKMDGEWADRPKGGTHPFANPRPQYVGGSRAQTWHELWAREAFRLLKPGGHLLAFGGTRTYHRLACAIEDAGFEIRDCLVWAYASGFPKSLDVSKAIDKAAGAERAVVGRNPTWREAKRSNQIMEPIRGGGAEVITAPATDLARQWDGWGTALKPAWEPIVMARKPLIGTVARNVTAHGTGAINVDATRIGTDGGSAGAGAGAGAVVFSDGLNGPRAVPVPGMGRWPANVVLTDDVLGEYSRFFTIPKAARADREPVLRGQLAERAFGQSGGAQAAIARGEEYQQEHASTGLNRVKQRANVHPTVKPVELMRHLVRLVTPPGGTVLDPFAGSGSTLLAAELEGFAWIGIEKEPEYVAIAEARLNGTQRGLGLDVAAPTRRSSKAKGHWPKERTPGKDGWGFTGQTELEERHA